MPTNWSDDIVVVELEDEPSLSDELSSVADRLKAEPNRHVVLDCSRVTYLNSSNIGQLLKLRKILMDAGQQMRLCGVTDAVWTLMLATGLDKVFVFAPDPLTALAGLQLEGASE
ncbi:MAG: STAS domain-containing protein [Phycisphaeraceae bacterium]|nr:STAS domain-containing protein [Phycisphaerales bacterium]MCB9861121.1 STAS domain-containing protein [Phycisphaeraceae bacterium]